MSTGPEKIESDVILAPDKINSADVIPPGELKLIEHSQWIDRWRHQTSAILIGASFLVICATILLPYHVLDPYREKAWTLLTVMVSSAVAFLYSSSGEQR